MTAPTQPPTEGLSLELSQGRALHLTNEYSEYVGEGGDHCTVIKSNVKQIPAGSTVTYQVAADLRKGTYDGGVILQANPGDAAFGHCIITDLVQTIGTCEFTSGTGRLEAFRASVVVSGDPNPLLAHWKGRFSLSPDDK